MNNQQFRRLILENTTQQDGVTVKPAPTRTPGTVLGARKHSSIPMTPRQVGRSTIQADFARQLAERNAKSNPQKKVRAAAPKGTKLAAGYIDRSKERQDEEDDELAKRIKNLEESMKDGQIDRETFEKMVQDITDGDISSTHLVKGLDRKLLERIRKGENVLAGKAKEDDEEVEEPGMEDAFDELAEKDAGRVVREKTEKKGETAPPRPVAGVKRSRGDILAELRRQREEAAAAATAEHEKKYPSLGEGFRKVHAKGESARIETDADGRQILIVTDADGKEKRKVRKQKVEESPVQIRRDLDDVKKPINMHNLPVPQVEESEDEDIFEGVGSSYNPLATIDDENDSSEEEEVEAKSPDFLGTQPQAEIVAKSPKRRRTSSESREGGASGEEPASDSPGPLTTTNSHAKPHTTKRDYFKNSSRIFAPKDTLPSGSSAADATVRAALQKVRTLDPASTLINDPDSTETRLKQRAVELAGRDRDMEDMDMGFGASRFDDAEEMEREGDKVKFSEWKGLGADEDEAEQSGKGAKKRKRGPKKKQGDKHSASDVLQAMERQKAKKTLG